MRRWALCFFAFVLPFTIGFASSDSGAYQEWIRGRVTVYGLESDFKTAQGVLATITRVYPDIESHLPFPEGIQFTVVIAPTDQEFNRLTAGQIPEWGIGAADISRSLIILKSPRIAQPEMQIDRIVIHELCHILLGQALKPYIADRWFDEGFAQFTSGEVRLGTSVRMARSLVTDQFLKLDDIDEVLSFQQDKAALAYAESRAAVAFLIETYGRDVIAHIVGSLSQGINMDRALYAAIGMGYDEFENLWTHTLKKKMRWFILLDYPLLVSVCLLVLFFAAFINARRKIKLKKSEPEEGLNGFEPG